jgi:hypothetical protein
MTKETRKLLEIANENLDTSYKAVRIAISDLRDEDTSKLREILNDIDKAKQELEKLLYPVSDVEIFELVSDGKRIVFSEANHI